MKRLAPGSCCLVSWRRRRGARADDRSGALIPRGRLLGDRARPANGRRLLTALSVAPGLLIMVTSFTRFIVALSFLRSGLGLQSTPANIILTSLALFMTLFVMAPTFDRAWQNGVKPMMDNSITQERAFTEIVAAVPRVHARATCAKRTSRCSRTCRSTSSSQADRANVDLAILIPAFMISELRRGFEIGFMIVLPFLVIDMVVATLTMSMGMMMLPPTVLSLPAKLLFFVMIDGWNLLIGSLVRSVA